MCPFSCYLIYVEMPKKWASHLRTNNNKKENRRDFTSIFPFSPQFSFLSEELHHFLNVKKSDD